MSDEKDREESKDAETTSKTTEGGAGAESDDADVSTEEVDAANPEAIARRVAALGEEDELDRIARQEEQKLAERRQAQKKGKKKSGLEVAASKKLQKIGKRAEPRRAVAVAADADPLIERTAKLSDWAKKNQKTVQLVGGAVAAGLLAVAGYLYTDHKHEVEASVLLSKAVADERARIGEPPKDEEEGDGSPVFKTYEARRDAALAKYREVETKYARTGAAILARLAEGSLLLDKQDASGALAAFEDVRSSPLAAADQEVKGRTLEGIGFAHELAAAKGDKEKNLDEAFKAYKELENTVDVRGFKELAMYHQARVLIEKGDKDKAKETLVELKERLSKPAEENVTQLPTGPAFPYLSEVAMDRLREIDPSAAPKAQGTSPGGSPQLTPAQIRKMIEDAQKKGAAGGHGGH